MAPFAGDQLPAADDRALDDDAAADAGAQGGAEDHARVLSRAVDRLREGEAPRIVRETDFPFKNLLQVGLERVPVVGRVVGVRDDAGVRGDEPGHADADPAGLAGLGLGAADRIGEHLERGRIGAARRGNAMAEKLAALRVERRERDLRAADVNAQPHSPRVLRRARRAPPRAPRAASARRSRPRPPSPSARRGG